MTSEEKPKQNVMLAILDRLSKLESQQELIMSDIRQSHSMEMDELRKRLERAKVLKCAALAVATGPFPEDLIRKDKVHLAVFTASWAAERSECDIQELLEETSDMRKAVGKPAIEEDWA